MAVMLEDRQCSVNSNFNSNSQFQGQVAKTFFEHGGRE